MSRSLPRTAALAAAGFSLVLSLGSRAGAEPAACASPNPPAPSKPYFMLLLDASDSMSTAMAQSSCTIANGYTTDYPANRIGGARCAIYNTVAAFGGQSNFGLAIFPPHQVTGTTGPATCPADMMTMAGCTEQFLYGANCGSGSGVTRRGGAIVVPMQQDNYWDPPGMQVPSNLATIEQWVDNTCSDCKEITLANSTPINGALRDMYRYLSASWTNPLTSVTYVTPLNDATIERPCRTVSVILMTDGAESCDTVTDAANAAAQLYTGFTIGTTLWKVKTYVIQFASSVPSAGNQQIATAGGTTAIAATDEAGLSEALAQILSTGISPEVCDNVDNNCNGCTDEGFAHYCDVQNMTGCCTWKTPAARTACGPSACACCSWATPAERTTCLGNYTASITPLLPKGDQKLLPCTTATQAQDPLTWLCFDPGDTCDNLDNNCVAGTDEGSNKCGSPLHCPQTEVCNGQDDDCNGLVDEGNVCTCFPSPETCDGCDNNCNGLTDDGTFAPIPCGPTGPGEPPNCQGTITCKPPVSVAPGACVMGGGYGTCNNNPQPETCDGFDNDCNGIVDDSPAGVGLPCVPTGAPPGLVYGGTSQCMQGTTACIGGAIQCVGWVGPSAEICDGVDNNCNGQVDEGSPGVGVPCGVSIPPCTPGTTACINGALVCSGGVQPKPEACNGIDDDCNGIIDDGALADAPAPGMNGCWDLPGTCCQFPATSPKVQWCPPLGGNCNDNGTLAPPCNRGVLTCTGGTWTCKGPKDPSPEICDGVDNDCNGTIDDGLTGLGTACGIAIGLCKQGTLQCMGGVLTCVGGVFPTQEICDGLDNDCDGTADNGIPAGGACPVPYDVTLFPGDRSFAPCKPGIYQCDGAGNLICVGGVGPEAEVCDGVDNDCDGQIDEPGAAPDGVNGSANPLPPPAGNIGDVCGTNQGACAEGTFQCINGQFACIGGKSPVPEQCDCEDNDCNGVIDDTPDGGTPLCSMGKDCIKSSFGCGCAEPCDFTKEFPCPGGQVCQDVTDAMGTPKGKYCVSDPCGGDCTGKTDKDANNQILCAPPGTAPDPTTCVSPPVCVCKGQNGCKAPCFGVTCSAGTVCAERGPLAGSCVIDTCYSVPCPGCGKACDHGTCVPNPCFPNPCAAGEECKPSSDFMSAMCFGSCAGKSCMTGDVCVEGACVQDCSPPCGMGQVCDRTQSPPACVADKCQPDPCTDGSCCDPLTGACGNCPCEGVLCPAGEVCLRDGCFGGGTGAGGGASSSSSGGTTSSSSGATASHSGGGGADGSKDVWGLATGGGGCACEVGPGASAARSGLSLVALALAIAARRRRAGARDQNRARQQAAPRRAHGEEVS